jgi:hypothetical protein
MVELLQWPPPMAATIRKDSKGFILVLEGFSWLWNTCNEQIRNQRKPNKTKIKPITVLQLDFNSGMG